MSLSELLQCFNNREDADFNKFNNITFGRLKQQPICGITAYEVLTAVKQITEKFEVNMENFFSVPKKMKGIMNTARLLNEEGTGTSQDMVRLIHFNRKVSKISVRLDEIMILDDVHNNLTMKEFLAQIGPAMGATLNFLNYLFSIASLFAADLDFEMNIRLLMVLLLRPVQRFFTRNDPTGYVNVWGFHLRDIVPEDLTGFERVPGVAPRYCNINLRFPRELDLPICLDTQVLMALFFEPSMLKTLGDILSRLKFIKKRRTNLSRDYSVQVETILKNNYLIQIGSEKKYRINIHNLPQIRNQLTNAYLQTLQNSRVGMKLNAYIKGLYKVCFENLVKLEVGVRMVSKMFPSTRPETPPMALTPPPPFFNDTVPPTATIFLRPLDAFGPEYQLVPVGPAPVGWETDPSWNQNQFPLDGPITYEGNQFFVEYDYTQN